MKKDLDALEIEYAAPWILERAAANDTERARPMPVIRVPSENRCQAYGGGNRWGWTVIDNLNTDERPGEERFIVFTHYTLGALYGNHQKGKTVYDEAHQTAHFEGSGFYNGIPITYIADIDRSIPTAARRGKTKVQVFRDTDRDKRPDAGEDRLMNLTLGNVECILTYAEVAT